MPLPSFAGLINPNSVAIYTVWNAKNWFDCYSDYKKTPMKTYYKTQNGVKKSKIPSFQDYKVRILN